MPHDNVDTIRGGYELFNERRLDEWLMLFDPDVEWHTRRDEPDATTHRGKDGVRYLIETWTESFPDLRLEPEELLDFGDVVVGVTTIRGSGGASGIAVDDTYVFTYRFLNGRIVETHEYATKDEALEAAALSE